MKFFRQKSLEHNGLAVIQNLVMLMGIKVAATSVERIKQNPNYPSLACLSNSLSDWNIENMGVRLHVNQLSEIPYPAIAHLHKNNGHFVVLKEMENNQMYYIDPEVGLVTEPLQEFEKKWSGVALLVQPIEKSGENNYKQKRRAEIFSLVSSYMSVAMLSVVLVWVTFSIAVSSLPLHLLKILGGVFCLVLLQKQFGDRSSYVSAICRMGSHTDCDAVIHSPASKLFGLVHISEIGLLYFSGGVILISLGVFTNLPVLDVLFILNTLALPFTIFSVYYQGKIIKKWCPLCLAVMAIFWLEFIVIAQTGFQLSFSLDSLFLTFFSFSLPLIFWLTVRERFIDSFKVPGLERNLNRFLKSDRIFSSLLNQQPLTNVGEFSHEIVRGHGEAGVELTFVSNPLCVPCAHAHAVVDDLLERFGDKLRVRFRFAVKSSGQDLGDVEMLNHLFAISLAGQNGNITHSMSDWFTIKGKSRLEKWKDRNPVKDAAVDPQKVNFILSEHAEWCRKANIKATPTILINGKKLPDEFSIRDLKFHIRKYLENPVGPLRELAL